MTATLRTALRGIGGRAIKIDSERIGTVSVFPFTRQLLTNTSFLYATMNGIPSHTRVDGKLFYGVTNLEDVGYSAASNSGSQSKARGCGYMSRPRSATS